tara:strand:+ start:891 stop:1058 length:168 start_codon:yes stop_codon:yes gene_type:complete
LKERFNRNLKALMGFELRTLADAKAAYILMILFTLANFNKQAVTLRVIYNSKGAL